MPTSPIGIDLSVVSQHGLVQIKSSCDDTFDLRGRTCVQQHWFSASLLRFVGIGIAIADCGIVD